MFTFLDCFWLMERWTETFSLTGEKITGGYQLNYIQNHFLISLIKMNIQKVILTTATAAPFSNLDTLETENIGTSETSNNPLSNYKKK